MVLIQRILIGLEVVVKSYYLSTLARLATPFQFNEVVEEQSWKKRFIISKKNKK